MNIHLILLNYYY